MPTKTSANGRNLRGRGALTNDGQVVWFIISEAMEILETGIGAKAGLFERVRSLPPDITSDYSFNVHQMTVTGFQIPILWMKPEAKACEGVLTHDDLLAHPAEAILVCHRAELAGRVARVHGICSRSADLRRILSA